MISDAIMTLNDTIIDPEGVDQILRSLPTEEDVKKLQSLSLDDINRVGRADIFIPLLFLSYTL